jgi:hypothetical protein
LLTQRWHGKYIPDRRAVKDRIRNFSKMQFAIKLVSEIYRATAYFYLAQPSGMSRVYCRGFPDFRHLRTAIQALRTIKKTWLQTDVLRKLLRMHPYGCKYLLSYGK